MQSMIPYWSLFSLFITLIYGGLILLYRYFWLKIPNLDHGSKSESGTFVSVVIVGRNEAKNMPTCLNSIIGNSYPAHLFEIIYVDDHSEDESVAILQKLGMPGLKLIELKHFIRSEFSQSFKKMGIEAALQQAKGELILQTDADCKVANHWIQDHVLMFDHNKAVFTAGPVFIDGSGNWLTSFQKVDFLVNMGLTGAGMYSGWHYMGNGANMSYSKNAYLKADLEGTKMVASGDDMFLVQALAKANAKNIHFLKSCDSYVLTKPEKTFKEFFWQRIRWASKTPKYKNPSLLFTAAFVFLVNLMLVFNFFFAIWHVAFLYLVSMVLFIKLTVDYSFIKSISNFYRQKIGPGQFLFSSLLYPFYFLLIGMLSLTFRKYQWKERKIG
ncbi:MAG TPA: glycosyltransferase [Saprospiraceae bacterium]|nr:glycosyltransferase [Saprospiraceae bacterium]